MKLSSLLATVLFISHPFVAPTVFAQAAPPPPAADVEMTYYDRHKIDVSNLRDFYDGLLIADMMIHADAMFDAETKWKLTLYEMILLGSHHHQARSAYQLSLMGVPMDEIRAIWSPDYVAAIADERIQAAFEFVDVAAINPARVTADTHAALRMHFIDRQIAELIELVAINAAMATHDLILPIPTDQATIDWASANLAAVGWAPGLNQSSSPEEQRATLFVGEALETAHNEIMADWEPGNLAAIDPVFATDWINHITGYGISPMTFDGDKDGIEEPFDFYPEEYLRWENPDWDAANLPPAGMPPFDVAAYDYPYYQPSVVPETQYPLSDRNRFDTEWTRQSSLGTVKIDEYFSSTDRALDLPMKWEIFFVNQLASGCGHCQVHGAYGIYDAIEDDYPHDRIPPDVLPGVIERIQALFDFERSDLFTDAEKAAFRFARDAGPLPTRATAAHIEELRRYYSDREIQEILSLLVTGSWLSTAMQSQLTVTDRLSMAWALRYLTPVGWKPGVHTGLPHEQRRFHMTEVTDFAMAQMNSGELIDGASEWLGVDVPLAVDADGDGVEDGFDGFPNDPTRWADTDHDGIEDSLDDDIDGDGIANREEVSLGIFPYKADSDGDGVDDPIEIEAGTDPVDPRNF
ncbi:MAG: hypothetical protein AAF773_12220 [Cyanobacteria bacterium P01_D01_bin.115]